MRLLDDFDLEGPNGTHKSLVFELLGPSISDTIDARFPEVRLPGKLAKVIAKQALFGLDTLHKQKIGHGGKTEIGHVRRSDGNALEPDIPEYIVRPASSSYLSHSWSASYPIKIVVDFGESFLHTTVPRTRHTPLPVRAPEVIFRDRLDYHVDLWSMGCMLFELFVGQPPFDSFLITPTILVGQMREMPSDALSERRQDSCKTMDDSSTEEVSGPALQEWLEEMYFDGQRNEDLKRKI
ncbi:kinase-like domain-containing protein [Lipomyces orientalis]|uniref:Kinase-like domain-containing protein n=1 Tax=Lipomyces orientalis TaxID=1233043 RepID=A0ACC3TK63_9ASCO